MTGPALYVSFASTQSVALPGISGIVSAPPDTPTSSVVKWTAATGATGYRLERSTANGSFEVIAMLGNVTTYSDPVLTTNSTYRYRVTALNSAGYGASSPVATVIPTIPTSLPTPANFDAGPSTPGKIAVSWTGTTSSVAVVIERSVDGGISWSDLVTLPGSVHTYADTVSRATLYAYRISSKSYTAISATSGSVALLTVPPEVSAIQRTAVTIDTASFAWNASIGATGYLLETSTDGVHFAAATNVAGGVLAAKLTGLANGTAYVVRITATNAGGSSNSIKISGVLTLPATPKSITATVEDGPTVDVEFTPVTGASSYRIERRSPTRPWGLLVTLKAPATTYTDVQIDENQDYEYRVVAINDSGESLPSESVFASTYTGDPSISAPENLAASPGLKGAINLAWDPVGTPDGYIVQRLFGVAWKNAATVVSTVHSVPVKGLTAGSTAIFRVIALRDGVESTPSGSLSVTAVPSQIKVLKTLGTTSASSISLTWTGPAGSTVYKLERTTDRVTWETLTDTLNQALYLDTGLDAGTTYGYRVSAGNATGFSPASSTLLFLTAPAAPSNVTSQTSGKSVQVSWTDVSGETGYKIQGSIDGTKWSQVSVAKADATSAAIKPGKNTLFRIASFNKTGTSNFSSPTGLSSSQFFSIAPVPTLSDLLKPDLLKKSRLIF